MSIIIVVLGYERKVDVVWEVCVDAQCSEVMVALLVARRTMFSVHTLMRVAHRMPWPLEPRMVLKTFYDQSTLSMYPVPQTLVA